MSWISTWRSLSSRRSLDQSSPADRAAAERMAKLLGFHPLAIIVGSAFVQDGMCSLVKYPQMFQSHKARLLKSKSRQMASRYGDVFATFEISALALSQSSDDDARNALTLLDVLAFMYQRDVTESIFARAWAYEE